MIDVVLRGPGKNALSIDVMSRAIAALDAAPGEPVLLTGDGDAFSAGLNLKELAVLDGAGIERFLGLLDDLVTRLFHRPAPVVAWVNGHAIAGGAVLALTADVRVSTDDPRARIGLNESAIGLAFPPRVTKLAKARLPLHTRDVVILEGALYAPEDARAMGLVDVVSSDAERVARQTLGKLSGYTRGAYAENKRQLREGALALTSEEERAFREDVVPRWVTQRDALVAMLAKK